MSRKPESFQYYLAIDCLGDVLQLNPHDATVLQNMVHWAVFLEEWSLATALIDHSQKAVQKLTGIEDFVALMACYRLVVELNTSSRDQQVNA